jgi:hypothetical protein
VQKLEVKLAELKKLKNAHENDLLEKFSLLLNEKKLKIRDQQWLLASSNVDPARLADVEESRSGRAHSAGPSRGGKRKTDTRVETDEQSDSFENMEVDEAPESEQDQPQTPQDGSTADEASEDEAPVPPPTRSNRQKSPMQASLSTAPPPPKDPGLPPKRDLPF